jgi:taurine dioxygenase
MAFQITRIAGALGAQISGIDLSRPLDASAFDDIRQALLTHGVIALCDQTITPAQQVAFARRFGEIHQHPHIAGLPEQPEIAEIVKAQNDVRNFGGGWHTDQMFLPEPVMATLLYAKELPAFGGDTLFADLHAAYDALSSAMQRMLAGMRSVNLADAGRPRTGATAVQAPPPATDSAPDGAAPGQYAGMGAMKLKRGADFATRSEHPLIRIHPETGRKGLYVGLHTERFADMTVAESAPLLDFLIAHATRPEFTCRLRWHDGMMAIWDNRRVLHNAINDYPGQRRRMHRITIAGDRPV